MRHPFLRYLIIFAIWSIPAALVTAITFHESRHHLWRVVVSEFLPWYYWALITIPIARHARTYSIQTLRSWRGVLRHIALGLLAGATCGLIAALASIALDRDVSGRMPPQIIISAIVFWCIFGMIFYALITAIGLALATQEKLRAREAAAAALETRLVEAQLSGLRAQLQPHFLFNTLNTVAMYVRDGDAATSIRVLTRLSELLRRVLDTGAAQEVPLALELEHVQRYLEIEALRFSDRLRVEVDVDAALHNVSVPTLALQPLVENAIQHGIAARSGAVLIRISAFREDTSLVIDIYNDGPALPADWTPDLATGIGLRNTALRLQYLYGEHGTVALTNTGNGVRCRVRVPYE